MLHAEFSAMDYTLNVVSKCRFFFIFKHSRVPKKSWKIFHGGPGKSWKSHGFFVSKRVGTLLMQPIGYGSVMVMVRWGSAILCVGGHLLLGICFIITLLWD